MTATEMLPLLQAWQKRHAELSSQMEALSALTGGTFEGPLFDAVWGAWSQQPHRKWRGLDLNHQA